MKSADPPMKKDIDAIVKEKVAMSYCIERIFLITLDNGMTMSSSSFLPVVMFSLFYLQSVFLVESGGDRRRPSHCVFLEDLHATLEDQEWLDLENMSQVFSSHSLMPLLLNYVEICCLTLGQKVLSLRPFYT